MQISFFEEFPTKENLSKIKWVNFPTKLYIAAQSLNEFQRIKISSKKVKEKIYWPILKKEEGYWFSPFTERKALLRTIQSLEKTKVPILWDAELPTHTNLRLYLTQSMNFIRNRALIQDFIRKRKNIYTAEYFPSSQLSANIFQILGLSFATNNHYPVKMIYSSMHDFGEEFIRTEIKQAKKNYGKRLRLAFGTLTHGIKGNEPVMDPKILERDLRIAQELTIEEIIIFRLGGMNKGYQNVINKFLS